MGNTIRLMGHGEGPHAAWGMLLIAGALARMQTDEVSTCTAGNVHETSSLK